MRVYPDVFIIERLEEIELRTHVRTRFNGKSYLIPHVRRIHLSGLDTAQYAKHINLFHVDCWNTMHHVAYSTRFEKYLEEDVYVEIRDIELIHNPTVEGFHSTTGRVEYKGVTYEHTVESLQTNSTMPDIEIKYV